MEKIREHNNGIDLLRCISMVMIVFLHLLSHGGVMECAEAGSYRYIVLSLLEATAYCGVDVFALISGYVMVTREYKSKKIFLLWCEVIFYSVALSVFVIALNPSILSVKGLIKSCFPTIMREYWYFTSYFAMFFFIPYMNNILKEKYAEELVLGCFIIFSCLPTIVMQDTFITNYGYSPIWLVVCYLIGGYLRLYRDKLKSDARSYFYAFGILEIFLWISKVEIQFLAEYFGISSSLGYYFLEYTSPFVLLAACCLLIGMSKVNFHGKLIVTLIRWFSSGSFAVYLIHEQYFVRLAYIDNRLSSLNALNSISEAVVLLLIVISIFVAASSIDHLRMQIFKLLWVEKFSEILVQKGNSILDKIHTSIKIFRRT